MLTLSSSQEIGVGRREGKRMIMELFHREKKLKNERWPLQRFFTSPGEVGQKGKKRGKKETDQFAYGCGRP